MFYAIITFIIVIGLAVLPISYYLRSRRNPTVIPPKATEKTFKEWKD